MVTKVVPVRAVELSIGAFCIEFRCEQLCDDDIFWIGINFWHFLATVVGTWIKQEIGYGGGTWIKSNWLWWYFLDAGTSKTSYGYWLFGILDPPP